MNVGAPRTLAHSWLLLIHQLPAKPAYLRVKIWRRLQDLGAVAVKNAVHALPMNEETQEDFEWLLREIQEGGGEAFVCEARLIDGLSDEEVRTLFDRGRETAEGLIKNLEARLNEDEAVTEKATVDSAASTFGTLRNRTWVTRQGVYADRIASAWLIRRFIDPEAHFKFVSGKGYRP